MSSDINDMLDQYFEIEAQIREAFKYKETWKALPLDDQRGLHWMLFEHKVVWAEEPWTAEMIEADGDTYSAERFDDEWVFRTDTHVMLSADTRTDDNKFLMIFDAALECTNEKIKRLYEER